MRFPVLLILLSAALLSFHAARAEFFQQGPKLVGTGNTGPYGGQQGYSVALSADGNTAIVGGPGRMYPAIYDDGAAWVFTRSAGVWTQQGAKLVGTGGGAAQQGVSVALSADGNTAIVGGPSDNAQYPAFGFIGAAWVFTRSGGLWTQQGAKLVGTGAVGAASQGMSVAVSADGNTAIVGGPFDNNIFPGPAGAAWVYTRSGGVWTQQGAKLVGTGVLGFSEQGYSVALSADGNTAIVGGPLDNGVYGMVPPTGAAWVFTRSAGVWTQQGAKLVGTGALPGVVGAPAQGTSVALSSDGNTALVGSPQDNGSAGAAWVFTRSGGVWTQQGTKLVGTGAVGNAQQGHSVALSGDGNTAVVGGPTDNLLSVPFEAGDAGAAWVFTRSGGVWTQQNAKLVGTGTVGGANQGNSVTLSADGNTAIVGGPADNGQAGSAWAYARAPGIGLVYQSLEPCRIMDTRSATLASGVQGPIVGQTLYQIPGYIASGSNWGQYGGSSVSDCGLTSPPGTSIHAVAIVITILNPNFDGFLGVGDVNSVARSEFTLLSHVAVNYTHGQGLSTAYLVPQVSSNIIYFAVPTSGLPVQLSVQLIFDVVGYYVESDATALQCTQQISAPTTIAGSGGTGSATSPACGAGYTLTAGSCDSDLFGSALYQYEAAGNSWLCSAINRGASGAHLTATANCCRVPGR